MARLTKHDLTLGYMPLTDAAPLIVAFEMGIFARWGLQVYLQKQHSWGTLRDKLHAGLLDAAQVLAPMPISSSLGLGVAPMPVITPMVLSLNGNAITLSEPLYREILHCNRISTITLPMATYLLQSVIEKRRQQGVTQLKFASVFPYSCHYYQLLDWLHSAELGEEDVTFVTVPPTSMLDYLETGEIDGFCVGGPWSAKAVRAGLGITVLTSFDMWQDSIEKVLGLTERFYLCYPDTVLALIAALQEACNWLEGVPNRFEAARMLAKPQYLDTSLDVVAPSLLGSCLTHQRLPPRYVANYNQFSGGAKASVNRPDPIRAEWLLKEMYKAGQLDGITIANGFAQQVYRLDIYQQVFKPTGRQVNNQSRTLAPQ